MSNLAHYSPFNRSYQFIHLQNSAYHLRNKNRAKARVNTNLSKQNQSVSDWSQKMSRSTSNHPSSNRYSQFQRCQSARANSSNSKIDFKEPYRIIHKNQSFEKAKTAKINHQNVKLIHRLLDTDCLIEKKQSTEQNFKRHQKYRNLRRRYQQNGQRNITAIVNMKHLNPALANYKNSQSSSSRRNFDPQMSKDQIVIQWLK